MVLWSFRLSARFLYDMSVYDSNVRGALRGCKIVLLSFVNHHDRNSFLIFETNKLSNLQKQ